MQIIRPTSFKKSRLQPLCEYSRMFQLMGDKNPRYSVRDIVELDLELPERTTMIWEEDSY